MPLVRFSVRNEYGLGAPELYKDAVEAEDPKAVLEGVNVAALVGVLRQLGDLAEFAAEVFHGLQEQVASTSSRSRKLGARVQRTETSLPQLEKTILSQTSHIHFAYSPGTEWHVRIRTEQNHFIYDDLLHFIMDSYEECREPPHLQLLDRFDAGGPGSCLKRYSDPTFFRRASVSSGLANNKKSRYEKKARKSKRRSWRRSGHSTFSGRIQLCSNGQRDSSSSHTGSSFETSFKSGKGGQSDYVCSKDGIHFVECVRHSSTAIPQNDTETMMESSSGQGSKIPESNESTYLDKATAFSGTWSPVMATAIPYSSSTTWDKKTAVPDIKYRSDDIQDLPKTACGLYQHDSNPHNAESINQVDNQSEYETSLRSNEGDLIFQNETILEFHGNEPKTFVEGKLMRSNDAIDEVQDVLHQYFEVHDHSIESAKMTTTTQVPDSPEGEKTLESHANGKLLNEEVDDSKLGGGEICCVSDTNSDVAEQNVETTNPEHVSQEDAFSEGENTLTVIEWRQFDDIESETDNFVDALNTIDSESESDFEGQIKKTVDKSPCLKNKGEYNMINEQKAEMINDGKSEDEHSSTSNECMEDITTSLQHSQALVPSTGTESPEHAQSPCDESPAIGWKLNGSDCLIDASQHSTSMLSSVNILSLEQSVLQSPTPDESICLFDEQFMQSEKSSVTCLKYSEHDHLSFNDLAVEGQKVDDTQCSAASFSSAAIVPLDQTQSSVSELAVVEGQKLDDSTCLLDKRSLEPTKSPSNGSAVEGHMPNDLQFSTVSLSSVTLVSPEPPQSSSNELLRGQKLEGSTIVLDDHSVLFNKSCAGDFESPEHAELYCTGSEGEKLVHHVLLSDDTQCSTAPVSSSTIVSRERSQLSCFESAKMQGENLNLTCLFDEQSAGHLTSSLVPNISEGINFSNHKPEVCDMTVSISHAPSMEVTCDASHFSQEIPLRFSSSTPPAFWTNGNLLGLAPSKPTVMITGDDLTVGQSNPDTMRKVNGLAKTQAPPLKDFQCMDNSTKEAKINIGDQYSVFSKYNPYQLVDEKCNQSIHQDKSNLTDLSLVQGLDNGYITHGEIEVPSSSGMKNGTGEVTNRSEDNSSLLSFFGRGLLKNGLTSGSLRYEEKSETNNCLSKKFEYGCHPSVSHAAQGTNLKEEFNSPVNSPPLEQMKIYFQPINGFESSRLKLKYPERVDHHENTIDMFPSFQLMPEPSNLRHDICSDSDGDTFGRSYTCMSDDFLNHPADSNSEEWESDGSSESNNHAVYDSFHRILSAESTSSSPYCEDAIHGSIQVGPRSLDGIILESGSTFDLPVLDTKNPFSYQEMKVCPHKVLDSSYFQEQTRKTPPLPPVQWRVSRSPLDASDIHQDRRSDNVNHSFDLRHSASSIPCLVKVDEAEGPSRDENSATITKTEKLDEQKIGSQQQNSCAENGRKDDEMGGFLHQIRAKSFNLKRAEPNRSTYVPSSATSNKVNAIIQKANAIRKVMASDDGEDDSWSDA